MSSPDDAAWIVIPGWEKFQHYKDRDPPWIKNYTRLLRKDEYLDLTAHQRAVLHGIWLLAAQNDNQGQVRLNTSSLSRQLNLRVSSRQLESLNHAGFIEFSASKVLHQRQRQRHKTPSFLPTGTRDGAGRKGK